MAQKKQVEMMREAGRRRLEQRITVDESAPPSNMYSDTTEIQANEDDEPKFVNSQSSVRTFERTQDEPSTPARKTEKEAWAAHTATSLKKP